MSDNGSTWIGKPVPRKEDARLIRGEGRFVDDFRMAGVCYLQFVRSPYAHAKVVSVDVSNAENAPGVVATLTGQEIAEMAQPFMEIGPPPGADIIDYPMATDRVRYQGEPVAAVIATSRMQAADASELASSA